MDFPFVKEAISALFQKSSCDMYPFKPSEAAPNYRGRIVFHPDKCINCMLCERVCSGNAITHLIENTPEGDYRVTRTFYLGSCTFCATCMDFCDHGAIEFTRDYHMIATREEDLMVSGTFIKKAPKKKAPPPAPKAEAASAACSVTLREDGNSYHIGSLRNSEAAETADPVKTTVPSTTQAALPTATAAAESETASETAAETATGETTDEAVETTVA